MKSAISDTKVRALINRYPGALTRTELMLYGASEAQLRRMSLRDPRLFRKVRRNTPTASLAIRGFAAPLASDPAAQELIRDDFGDGRSLREVSERHGYSIRTIRCVINNRAPYNKK